MAEQGSVDPQGQKHPLANYNFSPDELRVLKECNTESFFQRSLPIGTAFGLATFLGVNRGILKGNAKWGATPKIVLSVIFGYFLGKFSYQRKCAEKIMQLPNSQLAQLLRQKKRGGIYESLTPDQGFGAGLSLPAFGSQTEQYSDENLRQANALNLDTERPSVDGLDDGKRLTLDSPVAYNDDLPLEPPKNTVTYDELRKHNREEYNKKSMNPYSRPIERNEGPIVTRPPPLQPERQDDYNEPRKSGPKNKYGDVWSQ